ncbi:MAG: phage major capsid protein, partial [Terriglobia bacterium]|nr:phage major capsid protein [Terriglobia bacterium]
MSTLELKALGDELRSTWERDLKPRLSRLEGGETEVKGAVDRVNDRLDLLEAGISRASNMGPSSRLASAERKDLVEFARTGRVTREGSSLLSTKSSIGAGSNETKVLAIRDESLGGVLAPADYVATVVKGIIQFSPIRQISTVRQTSRTSIQFPVRTGNFAAQWTSEVGSRTETTGRTYGLEEISTSELYARVLISNWDLEDPVVDLEEIITQDMVLQFAKAEGTAFVSGSGVGQPEGILSDTDVQTSAVLNGGASFANGDGLIKLAFSVKEQYWPNARYVLNRFTLRDIRTLKDTQGNYLWQPAADGIHGLSTGLPAT